MSKISQPQWQRAVMQRAVSTPRSTIQHQKDGELSLLDEEDNDDLIPSSLITGEGEHDDSSFADDEYC